MKRMTSLLMLLLGWSMLGVGCAPYINIPPVPGDVASHDPNNINVPRAERVALGEALRRFPPEGDYLVALPEGSTRESYRQVLERLPPGGRPVEAGEQTGPIYEVAAVYIRGTRGQVDVIPPARGEARPRLFTVYLDYGFNGWGVSRTRQWNIPVERALRSAAPAERRGTGDRQSGDPANGATPSENTEPSDDGASGEAPADAPGDGDGRNERMLPPLETQAGGDHIFDSTPD